MNSCSNGKEDKSLLYERLGLQQKALEEVLLEILEKKSELSKKFRPTNNLQY
jgi:hypothetical protein